MVLGSNSGFTDDLRAERSVACVCECTYVSSTVRSPPKWCTYRGVKRIVVMCTVLYVFVKREQVPTRVCPPSTAPNESRKAKPPSRRRPAVWDWVQQAVSSARGCVQLLRRNCSRRHGCAAKATRRAQDETGSYGLGT